MLEVRELAREPVARVALQATITLEGVVPAELHPIEIVDHDGDEIPELMVKFDRSVVQELASVGDDVEFTVIGKWGQAPFRGSDTIRVIEPGEGWDQSHGNKPEVPPSQSGKHPSQGQGPPQVPPGQGGQPPSQGNQGNQDKGNGGNQGQAKGKNK